MNSMLYTMVRVGTLAMTLSIAAEAQSPAKLAQDKAQIVALASRMIREVKEEDAMLARLPSPAAVTSFAAMRLQTIKAEEAQLDALDRDAGLPVTDWAAGEAAFAAKVAKELACRVDARCLADRQVATVASGICVNLGTIRALTQRIQTERANPSGVVDLADLHSSGEDIQIAQANVAAGKAQYAKVAGKAFDASQCR